MEEATDQKRSDTTVFPLLLAYPFGDSRGLSKEMSEIKEMEIEWDSSYTSTVRRGYVIEAFERAGLLEEFVKECWPLGEAALGKSKIRMCKRIKAKYVAFLAGNGEKAAAITEEESEREEQAFAAEADLRDFLANNLDCIEKGLRLYEKDGAKGIEFIIEDGRIDLLGVDKNGGLVVIELKLSRGRNRTLGQLLYYMGWVDSHLGNGRCRGIVIAREIGEDLRLAAQRTPGVSLYSYTMSVSVKLVK